MKTIAEQLNIKDFPFIIKDKNGKEIYCEFSDGHWVKRHYNGNVIYKESSNGYRDKREHDSNGNVIYFEDSNGLIIDNRLNKRPINTMD